MIRPSASPASVSYAEDGRVRPDTKREREHGYRGEAWILQQLAEGEFKVVHGSLSVVSCPLLVAWLFIPHFIFRTLIDFRFAGLERSVAGRFPHYGPWLAMAWRA